MACATHDPRPSPKCLHDRGRFPKTRENSRGLKLVSNWLSAEPLSPKVARHHQLEETRSKGSPSSTPYPVKHLQTQAMRAI
jgi:hypothetical protein